MKTEILVVEDEVIVARDMQHTLIQLGYEVPNIAVSAEEAISRVVQGPPDLVLMDIHLQGDRDGIDAATEIRVHCDVPVVYVTAYADSTTLNRAKVTQPFGYVLKPCNERELHTNIEISLYRHQMEQDLRTAHEVLQEAHDEISRQLRVASGRDRLVQAQMRGATIEEAHDEILRVFADTLPVERVSLRLPQLDGDAVIEIASCRGVSATAGSDLTERAPCSDDEEDDLVDEAFRTCRPQCDAGRRRAAVPILYRAHPIAVVLADVSRDAPPYSKTTLNCMCSLAAQAALLLRMARITDEISSGGLGADELLDLADARE